MRSLPLHRNDLCLRQAQAVGQSHFRTDGSVHWDAHRHGVGLVIAGAWLLRCVFIPQALGVDKEAIASSSLNHV